MPRNWQPGEPIQETLHPTSGLLEIEKKHLSLNIVVLATWTHNDKQTHHTTYFGWSFHMDVASLSPHTFLRFKDSWNRGPSSLRQSFRYKWVHNGCSHDKNAAFGTLFNVAPKGLLVTVKNQLNAWPYQPVLKAQFSGFCSVGKLSNLNKSCQNIVVRSELAETGNYGVTCPLSEFEVLAKIRGLCFYAVTAVAAILLFPPMVVVHPLVLLLDPYRRKVHHFIAKLWSILTVAPFYRIKIQGWENLPSADTPAVFVSNHQSFLDIYTLLTLGRNFKFISKTSIFLFPIIGWAMHLMGTICLKRMDSRSQLECLKRCMDLIKKGASVFFFPEGTRSKDGKLGAFKKGAFSVAAKTGVPVVPVTLIGSGKIMPAGFEGIVNSGSVEVIIHKPIEVSNAGELCIEARRVIADALNCQ